MTEPVALVYPLKRAYGRCPVCLYQNKLRTDGTLGAHSDDPRHRPQRLCPGTGEPAARERSTTHGT